MSPLVVLDYMDLVPTPSYKGGWEREWPAFSTMEGNSANKEPGGHSPYPCIPGCPHLLLLSQQNSCSALIAEGLYGKTEYQGETQQEEF